MSSPIIITIKEDARGNVTMSKKELQEYINMAYNDGYKDGAESSSEQIVQLKNQIFNSQLKEIKLHPPMAM